jgi:glyoxylase-like metal-dependent hydrolase (beta-lactamase superfamily II)
MPQPLQFKLFIRKRASATRGVPPGKDDLKWVANTTTLIYGEQDALLVDTFLSDGQSAELADWIAATGKRLSTIYITHAHPDHFFALSSCAIASHLRARSHYRRSSKGCTKPSRLIPLGVGSEDSRG